MKLFFFSSEPFSNDCFATTQCGGGSNEQIFEITWHAAARSHGHHPRRHHHHHKLQTLMFRWAHSNPSPVFGRFLFWFHVCVYLHFNSCVWVSMKTSFRHSTNQNLLRMREHGYIHWSCDCRIASVSDGESKQSKTEKQNKIIYNVHWWLGLSGYKTYRHHSRTKL